MQQVQLLVALGLLTCASASMAGVPAALGAGSRRGLRLSGGASEYKAVRLGFPVNSDEDPNAPYMYIDHDSPEGNAFKDSDETAELFDVDWASARRKISAIVTRREEAAALRLRGGAPQAAAKVGAVPVTLECSVLHIKPINSPKVKVVVCGDGPELGEWDIAKGITLEVMQVSGPSKDSFPLHTATINLPAGKDVEYKYAVVRAEPGDGIGVQWEAQNRKLSVPASGSLMIKNEFVENRETDPRITDEPFQCNAQEWARWYKHHVGQLTEIGPAREG
mmetsp:Transcript_36723/g.90382  ORF Transcript_36723/g.90382 Transcript_36723/m.90382 type:complete len:278 (+) Transcript_36723:66-899(+)